MNRLVLKWRTLQRDARDLASYVRLDRHGTTIQRKTDFTHCPRPVLMLYGFLSTRRVLQLLELRLRRDGYCVWSIHLGGLFDLLNTKRIDESAELVRRKVERMYARYDMGPLSIIAHSKGGLIGRYYVQRLGGDQRVRTLVTLGTPHQGTTTAYLGCAAMGAVAPSVWQMTPRSRFLRSLNAETFPAHVRLVSIYSRADGIIRYPGGVLPPGPNSANVELANYGHKELLMKRAVYAHIQTELARPADARFETPMQRPVMIAEAS